MRAVCYCSSQVRLTTHQPHPVSNQYQAWETRGSIPHVSIKRAFVYDAAHAEKHRTGVHTVADAFCMGCNERLGWYYHKAADSGQKYKEGAHRRKPVSRAWVGAYDLGAGKYLLERERLVKENNWSLDDT